MRQRLPYFGILVAAVLAGPASADEIWGFVQITCAPELGYVSVRRVAISNLPNKGPYLTEGLDPGANAIALVGRKYGIFDSHRLKTKPFRCVIPEVKLVQGWDNARPGFTVEIVGRFDNQNGKATSYRQIVDAAEVILDGKSIDRLHLNPYGLESGTDVVEIAHNGTGLVVRTCSASHSPSDLVGSGTFSCKEARAE